MPPRRPGLRLTDLSSMAAASVTVVVPCYNQHRFLAERFASIIAQAQFIHELIFVDDASTDGSSECAAQTVFPFPSTLIRNAIRNGCPQRQWETGIRRAVADWIWIAEADDTAEPDLLPALLAYAQRNPSAGFVFCQSRLIDEHGSDHGTFRIYTDEINNAAWSSDRVASGREELADHLLLRNIIPNVSACLIRRDLWHQILPLATNLRLCGDWLCYARLALLTDIGFVARPLNGFRTHPNSVRSTTQASRAVEEGYQVRHAIARSASLSRGQKELAARYAAEEWTRLLGQSGSRALDEAALQTAVEFDPLVRKRLNYPSLRETASVELFYAERGHFLPEASIRRLLPPDEWIAFRALVPRGMLRLDPADRPGTVRLRAATVRDPATACLMASITNPAAWYRLPLINARWLAEHENVATIRTSHADPQVILPWVFSGPVVLEVQLCFSPAMDPVSPEGKGAETAPVQAKADSSQF